MKIGAVLRELRESRRLTQMNVSEQADISQTFLSQLEAGFKNPSAKTLNKLCALYGVPPQIAVFKSIEEGDIQKKKLPIYRKLKPTIDELISELIK